MASYVLYPPIVDDFLDGYKIQYNENQPSVNNKIKVYFTLSNFNALTDFSSVHAIVSEQKTGANIVNKSKEKYNKTGIILNLEKHIEGSRYYVELLYDDIKVDRWQAGSIFKIQLRLSDIECPDNADQANWIGSNAGHFSEWSTVCRVSLIKNADIEVKVNIQEISYM